MAGKPGQKSEKPADIPEKFDPAFLANMDGRTVVARELQNRLNRLMNDLGGTETFSYQQRALCRRAIFLEARLENMEASAAQGKETPIHEYVTAVNSLSGLFSRLGLRRRPKEVTLKDVLNNGAEAGGTA